MRTYFPLAAAIMLALATHPACAADSGRISFTKTGEPLAYELVHGVIVFRGTIAGRPVWMTLDNGATDTVVDLGLAGSLGLRIAAIRGERTDTLNGATSISNKVDAVPLALPGQFAGTLPLRAAELSSESAALGRPIGAIIGHDLTSLMVVRFDPATRRLSFTALRHDAAGASGATLIPVHEIDGKDVVEARIAGRPVSLTLDFGFSGSVALSTEAWARVAPPDLPTTASRLVDVTGKSATIRTARLPAIDVAGLHLADAPVAILPSIGDRTDGLIGMGVLSRYAVALDAGAGTLILTAPATG